MPFLVFEKFLVPFNRFLLLHENPGKKLLLFCPGTARSVWSSLVSIEKRLLPKQLPYFSGISDNVQVCFMLLILVHSIKDKNSHSRWDYTFIQLTVLPPVRFTLQVGCVLPQYILTVGCNLGISLTPCCISVSQPSGRTWSICLPSTIKVALLTSRWLFSCLLFSMLLIISMDWDVPVERCTWQIAAGGQIKRSWSVLESAGFLRAVFVRENEFFSHTWVSEGIHNRGRTQLTSIHLMLPGPNDKVIPSWAEEGKLCWASFDLLFEICS